ncbi:efflux RND transporter periplasmic adaptor subunit [Thiohalobacter thiocyanaticus]|uniref:HlyD family efflux transporter periplasmic adaptor subunit n=1 Tax=Thiohalobacter thiocyanaticus TaxID=585455 RepID=A0A426QIG0_9GAMM|nr:HlyD family efflux transporter periplasmic adaptor subunit [Thiohalobacter thiocyanaticus]RRQ21527.1 HlyD family efflux transporter periplasmic adaptor subunit [Thiohalobacter thiocyanaticus]
MKLNARLGILLLGLVLAAALVWGFMPRPVPVEPAGVTRGPLTVTVEEEGRTRVRERYLISAPVSGYLRRITLEPGDAVAADQPLAVIEPRRADALDPRSRARAEAGVKGTEAALAAAREEQRSAAAQAALADQALERARRLHRAGDLSDDALDRAEAEAVRSRALNAAAQHSVEVARFELETARAALASYDAAPTGESFTLTAPIDGRVLKRLRESAGPVQAGEPLLELGDPARLEVVVELLSTQAVQIAPGTRVSLERWGGETDLEGVVRVVEPAGFTKISALGVEEQRVLVIIDFRSPSEQWQRLGDAYRVEARFRVWEGEDVLQIPASALFRHNGGWGVFRIASGRAQLTPVEVGQRAGLTAQILSGLEPGEQVISHPDDQISDGVRVTY